MASVPGSPDAFPAVPELDAMAAAAFEAAVAPLFEGAPRFLARLADARPFGSADVLFERSLTVALAMPEEAKIELLDAHPRLGAAPGSVSALSFVEQGYERPAGEDADDRNRVDALAELERLNVAYERRFGFRYCVFVAGRSRAELLPGFHDALKADRDAEIRRGVRHVVAIARDRHRRLTEEAAR